MLRNKQVFVIETDGNGKFAFRAANDKYLAADRFVIYHWSYFSSYFSIYRELTANSTTKEVNEWFNLFWKDGIAYIQAASGKFISVDQRNKISCKTKKIYLFHSV